MKRNDITALHQATDADLNKKLVELAKALNSSKLEKEAGKLSDLKKVTRLRDDIARVKTIVRQRELTGAK